MDELRENGLALLVKACERVCHTQPELLFDIKPGVARALELTPVLASLQVFAEALNQVRFKAAQAMDDATYRAIFMSGRQGAALHNVLSSSAGFRAQASALSQAYHQYLHDRTRQLR